MKRELPILAWVLMLLAPLVTILCIDWQAQAQLEMRVAYLLFGLCVYVAWAIPCCAMLGIRLGRWIRKTL